MSWEKTMMFITNESDLKITSEPTALYFYADWMHFHKKMMIMIEKVEKKFNTAFYAIDADSFGSLCKRYGVDSIPTVIIYNQRKQVNRIDGLAMTSSFVKTFADIYGNKENNI